MENNPYFSSYKYINPTFGKNDGHIVDIMVNGGVGKLTVEWVGPNNYKSDSIIYSNQNNEHCAGLYWLQRGIYVGTVTDEEGNVGTVEIELKHKERFYLGVTYDTTTEEGNGYINIESFQHDEGTSFKYELSGGDLNNPIIVNPPNKTYQFNGLNSGLYTITASQTDYVLYDDGGNKIIKPIVEFWSEINDNCGLGIVDGDEHFYDIEYQLYLGTKIINKTQCSGEVFIDEDRFKTHGSVVDTYIEIVNSENKSVDGLIDVVDEIIRAPKPNLIQHGDKCEQASYRISISRRREEVVNPCGYTSFELGSDGLLLFTTYDNNDTHNMSSECCTSLGFSPELDEQGLYVCRWKEVYVDPCEIFNITENVNNDGYAVFINTDTGGFTDIVPTSECCENENLPFTQNGEGYSCIVEVEEPEPTCDDYTFTGEFTMVEEVEETCVDLQTKYDRNLTMGTQLGSICTEVIGGIRTTKFIVSGNKHNEHVETIMSIGGSSGPSRNRPGQEHLAPNEGIGAPGGGETSLRCAHPSSVLGQQVNNFIYNGETIRPDKSNESLWLVRNDHKYNTETYKLYARWLNAESLQPSLVEVYLVCNKTLEPIEEETSYAIFEYEGERTTSVLSEECCDINGLIAEPVEGEIRCVEKGCESYTIVNKTSEGLIQFDDGNGNVVSHVEKSECCESLGFEARRRGLGGYNCYGEPEDDEEETPTLHEQQYQWFPSEQAACESIGDHTTVRTTYYTERPDFYNPGTIYEDPEGTIMAAGGIYKEFSGPLWIEWTGSRVARQGAC